MRIICAGMSKCGTKSVHAALNEFGYKIYDFPENFEYFEDEYKRFKREGWTVDDFHRMYKDVDVAIDGPFYYFWEESLEAFPDAKVILMVRDNEEDWFRSWDNNCKKGGQGWHFLYYNFLSPTWRRFWSFATGPGLLCLGVEELTVFNEVVAISLPHKSAYRRHIAHVLHKCPKEKLLVYNCKEGWNPLCKFLDKPIPNKPFPRVNVKAELFQYIWQSPIFIRAKKEMLCSAGTSALSIIVLGIFIYKKIF